MVKLSFRAGVFWVGGLLATAALLPVRPALADTDIDALKQQVEALTRTVGELSHRVQGLEQKLDGMERGREPVTQTAVPKTQPPPAAPVPKATPPRPAAAATAAAVPPVQQVAPGELVPPAPPKRAMQGNLTVGQQAAQAVANYKPTPRESWAQLKEGMSQAQVTALLGVPTKTFKAGGQTVWYYYYRDVGAGSVFFYEDGHVASRQKPPFSGWHW